MQTTNTLNKGVYYAVDKIKDTWNALFRSPEIGIAALVAASMVASSVKAEDSNLVNVVRTNEGNGVVRYTTNWFQYNNLDGIGNSYSGLALICSVSDTFSGAWLPTSHLILNEGQTNGQIKELVAVTVTPTNKTAGQTVVENIMLEVYDTKAKKFLNASTWGIAIDTICVYKTEGDRYNRADMDRTTAKLEASYVLTPPPPPGRWKYTGHKGFTNIYEHLPEPGVLGVLPVVAGAYFAHRKRKR